ncbi:MAG: Fur family transcriptional regulator [Acidobacteriota bacterium]
MAARRPTRSAPSAPVRRTRQRRAIRLVLERAGRPLTAAEVRRAAGRRHRGLGIATVYRTLNALVAEGFLVTVRLPGEGWRFELAGKGHHHHFQCRGCGQAFELDGCPRGLGALAPSGFQVESHEVVLYGRCASCAG